MNGQKLTKQLPRLAISEGNECPRLEGILGLVNPTRDRLALPLISTVTSTIAVAFMLKPLDPEFEERTTVHAILIASLANGRKFPAT